MTGTSTKTPTQLIDVLSNLAYFSPTADTTTVSLTPEIIRDLQSLVDWCDDAQEKIDDAQEKIDDAQDEIDDLHGLENVLEDTREELDAEKLKYKVLADSLSNVIQEMRDDKCSDSALVNHALHLYSVKLENLLYDPVTGETDD